MSMFFLTPLIHMTRKQLVKHLSSDQNPIWLGCIGNEILPSYIRDYFIRNEAISTIPRHPGEHLLRFGIWTLKTYLSNEKNIGWLGYIGDYTTQLYRDYHKPL